MLFFKKKKIPQLQRFSTGQRGGPPVGPARPRIQRNTPAVDGPAGVDQPLCKTSRGPDLMRWAMKLLLWVGGVVVGLAAVVYVANLSFAPLTFVPAAGQGVPCGRRRQRIYSAAAAGPSDVKEAYWLDQTWSHRDRFWFHHASQGTATLPVPNDWFVELQRGELPLPTGLRRCGLRLSPALRLHSEPEGREGREIRRGLGAGGERFGYHGRGPADVVTAAERDRVAGYPDNPDGLPVGFARLPEGLDRRPTRNIPISSVLPARPVTPDISNTGTSAFASMADPRWSISMPSPRPSGCRSVTRWSCHGASTALPNGLRNESRMAGQGQAPGGDEQARVHAAHHQRLGKAEQRHARYRGGNWPPRRAQSYRQPGLLQRSPDGG